MFMMTIGIDLASFEENSTKHFPKITPSLLMVPLGSSDRPL